MLVNNAGVGVWGDFVLATDLQEDLAMKGQDHVVAPFEVRMQAAMLRHMPDRAKARAGRAE